MFYRPLTSTLITFSFWLTLTAASVGQGDFDPSYFQRAAVESAVSESQAVEPIGSNFFEPEQPLSQASYSRTADYEPVQAPAIENPVPVREAAVEYFDALPPQRDISYSNEVEYLAAANTNHGTWRDRMRSHFHDASVGAATSGITASIFGGPGLIPPGRDIFGLTNGDSNFTGGVIGFAVGKRFNSRWRSELEFSWRNRTSSIIFSPGNFSNPTGENQFAGNFYYDFNRGPGKIVTPYLGIGLGASHHKLSIEDSSVGEVRSADTNAFALQGIGGLSFRISRKNEFILESRSLSSFFNRNEVATHHDLIFGLRHTF